MSYMNFLTVVLFIFSMIFMRTEARFGETDVDKPKIAPKRPGLFETMRIFEFDKPLSEGPPISIIDLFPKTDDSKSSRMFGKIAMFSFGGIGIMGVEHFDQEMDDAEMSKEGDKKTNGDESF